MTKKSSLFFLLLPITLHHRALHCVETTLAHLNNALTQLSLIIPPPQTPTLTEEGEKKYSGYTIECLLSSRNNNNPIEENDKKAVEDIIKNGEIICNVSHREWFNFPIRAQPEFEDNDTGKIRIGIFQRVFLRYEKGANHPADVTDAINNDYISLVRDTSKNVIAIGDGYLASQRTIRPYLNIITNKDISGTKELIEAITYNITNQAVNIYVNRSRSRAVDADITNQPLKFVVYDANLAQQLQEYLKGNNYYGKAGIVDITLGNSNEIKIQRKIADKRKQPETIRCTTGALIVD